MLEIKALKASIEQRSILDELDLVIKPGELHVIMGPNGSGKSTLANVLVGKEGYQVSGEVTFLGKNLLTLSPEERSGLGLFLSFQYPIEIPGITNLSFLKTAVNAIRKFQEKAPLDSLDLLELIKRYGKELEISDDFLKRFLNAGLSGGEKKRNEILQMLVLEPKLAILDEPDSGLDVDSLKIVAHGINLYRKKDNSVLLITHYQRLLELIEPDYIHIFQKGKIVKSGGKDLALQIEKEGYRGIK